MWENIKPNFRRLKQKMKKKILITLFITFLIFVSISSIVFSKTSSVEDNTKSEIFDSVFNFGMKVGAILYIILLILWSYFIFGDRLRNSKKKYGGIAKQKNINYCRELPQYINLENAYASLYYCSRIDTKTLKNGIIGAFILKWYNNDNIVITKKENKVFTIDLQDGDFPKTEIEQELYDILKMTAGNNNIIDNNELKEWTRNHKKIIQNWHDKILSSVFTDFLRGEAETLLGLKQFLLDYSLINERSHIEVKLWEQYLIYAQLLGISDKVNKEFSSVYPDYSKNIDLSLNGIVKMEIKLVQIQMFLWVPLALAIIPTVIISLIYYMILLLL